ncbi:hypothetical protein R5R35_011570 [Gryllus longicercus]|uniref:PHD-type domain-containing protein n=1 Tax=Gryllus longicercus TaxID=2509291 RepID=A0AAN9VGQ7_9ORTH
MGCSLEVYRARIGNWAGRAGCGELRASFPRRDGYLGLTATVSVLLVSLISVLLVIGGLELNPGPTCFVCRRALKSGAECSVCGKWYHNSCERIRDVDIIGDEWSCNRCTRKNVKVLSERVRAFEDENIQLRQENLRLARAVEESRAKLAKTPKPAMSTARKKTEAATAARVETATVTAAREKTETVTAAREETATVTAAREETATVTAAREETATVTAAREETATVTAAREETATVTAAREETAEVTAARESAPFVTRDATTATDPADRQYLVLGDSIVRHIGKHENLTVKCFPGIRTRQLSNVIDNLEKSQPNVIVLHVGTNDIKGRHDLDTKMGEMYDLATTVKKKFPKSHILLSGIIARADVSSNKIRALNDRLLWVARVQKMLFVDPNKWLTYRDLGRDGLHLNRTGAHKLGSLFQQCCEVLRRTPLN